MTVAKKQIEFLWTQQIVLGVKIIDCCMLHTKTLILVEINYQHTRTFEKQAIERLSQSETDEQEHQEHYAVRAQQGSN